MTSLKALVLMSLVAGLSAPVLADTIIKDPVREKALHEGTIINPATLNDCASAYAIPFGTTTVVGDGVTNLRLWYVWVGTGGGLHMESCLPGTNFDTDITIYSGTCPGGLTQVYYNDGPGACGWHTNLSCAAFSFTAGVTYYIRIDQYWNADIAAGMAIEMLWEDCAPPPPPPANDVWTGATPMSLGDCVDGNTNAPYTDTTGAYDITHILCPWTGYPAGASTGTASDAWYQIVLSGGMYTFDLSGSAYDTVIGIWDASHILLAGNDDAVGVQSKVECCQLPAGTYFLSVDGYGSGSGAFHLCVSECPSVDAQDVPTAYELKQNVPNPFNPTTTISFGMPETGVASLTVFDVAGRTVATLVSGMVEKGQHTVSFDAGNLTSGVYFYALQASGTVETRKMVLMK